MTDEWKEIAAAACEHAGLSFNSIETLASWDQQYCANAIYRLDGERYLKVFGPGAEWQFHTERNLLSTLDDHPVIPAPRLLAAGEPAHAQPYLVQSGVTGQTAEAAWDGLLQPDRTAIARELGTITAAIHGLPLDSLAEVARQHGGKEEHVIRRELPRRSAEIESAQTLSARQRNDLLRFLHGEALELINENCTVTHHELSHNHIYIARKTGAWGVTAIIDWADAMLGPPEWDVVYLWHWTFTTARQDREALRACLETLYADGGPPDRLARRCLAANLFTASMFFLWSQFAAQVSADSTDIVRDMTAYFYPPSLFGSPD